MGRSSLAVTVQEEIIRIEDLVAQKLVSDAVKLIATALRGHADHRPAGATVLGAVGIGADTELLDRVYRRPN